MHPQHLLQQQRLDQVDEVYEAQRKRAGELFAIDRLAMAEDPDFVHLRQQVLQFLYAKQADEPAAPAKLEAVPASPGVVKEALSESKSEEATSDPAAA